MLSGGSGLTSVLLPLCPMGAMAVHRGGGCGVAPMARFPSVRPPRRRGGTGGRRINPRRLRLAPSFGSAGCLVSYMPLASVFNSADARGWESIRRLQILGLSEYILSSPAAVALRLARQRRLSSSYPRAALLTRRAERSALAARRHLSSGSDAMATIPDEIAVATEAGARFVVQRWLEKRRRPE